MGKVFKSSFEARSGAYYPFQPLLWFGTQSLGFLCAVVEVNIPHN